MEYKMQLHEYSIAIPNKLKPDGIKIEILRVAYLAAYVSLRPSARHWTRWLVLAFHSAPSASCRV
jgi:hypothetical protein